MANENKGGYVLPHSVEAERAVLGAILKDVKHWNTVNEKIRLTSEHFFLDSHRKIYQSMESLDAKGKGIDVITTTESLIFYNNGSEPSTVGHSYLIELLENCPLTQNIEYYAAIVRKKYYIRRIINACQDTIHRALSVDGEVSSFVEEVEKEFLHITNDEDQHGGLVRAKDVLVPTLTIIENRIKMEGTVTGITSGFKDLDHFTGGWQKSDLIIIAARPGMGKTALALNWATHAARTKETTVAVFTLEMSKEQLMERLLAAEARVDSSRLRKGDLTEEDQDKLMIGARKIHEFGIKLVIDETPGITMTELRSRCRRYKKEHGLDMIVIDYLQLMSGSTIAKKQGREREISEISSGLKALAKELAVPIIAAAQLNRSPDARPDKRPRMSDLRESGSMEQDADLIMFIYRDEYYNANSEIAGKSEVIIAKNRHGETGTAYLAWLPNFVSFHSVLLD